MWVKRSIQILIVFFVALITTLLWHSVVRADDDDVVVSDRVDCTSCTGTTSTSYDQTELHHTVGGEYVPYGYRGKIPSGTEGTYWTCLVSTSGPGGQVASAGYTIVYLPGSEDNDQYRSKDVIDWYSRRLPALQGGWKYKVRKEVTTTYVTPWTQEEADQLGELCEVGEPCGVTEVDYRAEVRGTNSPICNSRNAQMSTSGWWETVDELYTPGCGTVEIIVNEDGSVSVRCKGHFQTVETRLSNMCAAVVREPYPRGLVGVPNHLVVQEGSWSASSEEIDWCTPDVQDYQLQMRVVPDYSRRPVWQWNDRAFSQEPPFAFGWDVFHTFQTSSFALPIKGPSLTGEWLPSYIPTVSTYWRVEVSRTWLDFFGRPQGTGWQPMDLTTLGYPDEDLVLSVWDATIPPPGAPYMKYPECIVPVPVTEAQGVLTR
jgi:hypothetical protein